jgi:hypothetical protein
MDHRLYTISVTKSEVEWVLNKSETEVEMDMLESRLNNCREGNEIKTATIKRILLTLGFNPDDEEKKYDIFNDEWWIEFEDKFKVR